MSFRGEPQDLPTWVPPALGDRWAVGTKAIKLTLKRMQTPRRIKPNRRFGLDYEDVRLTTSDGVSLAAWFIPAERDDIACVVHHHYGGQKATVLPWLQVLHARGIPALAIDGRGHGDSDRSPDGRGSFIKRAADIHAACDHLRARGFSRLLALGQSMGAATTAIGVSGRDDVVGLVLDSGPAPDMGTAAWGLAGNLLETQRNDSFGARFMLSARILPGTEPERYPAAIWTALARLRKTPLLWMHGGKDRVIRREWSGAWFRALDAGDGMWTSLLVPAADHVRCLQTDGAAVEAALDTFLERAVGP